MRAGGDSSPLPTSTVSKLYGNDYRICGAALSSLLIFISDEVRIRYTVLHGCIGIRRRRRCACECLNNGERTQVRDNLRLGSKRSDCAPDDVRSGLTEARG